MVWNLSLFLFLFLLFTIPALAQGGRRPPTPSGDPTAAPGDGDTDENRERWVSDLAKKANSERQAALKNDTEKLLKLAGELKEYVDKSNENVLSLDVMKKAEEIEKLAKSVKEKMKATN